MSFSSGGGSKEAFSFHCIICYEFLHPVNRPPVVLPCGHTHICDQCAKRLDKCMECREPLTTTAPTVAVPQALHIAEPVTSWRDIQRRRQQQNGMYRGLQTPHTPKPTPRKAGETTIALPTPRNLVLMSLIESMMYSFADELDQDGYQSGDDDEFVRNSIRIVGSSCGTYIVREKEGLTVYDRLIESNESLVNPLLNPREVKRLVYGQKVQILSFHDGVATVARGAGFITVQKSSQLVKVGDAEDASCKLETARRNLERQVDTLQKKIDKLKSAKERLQRKVQDALKDSEMDCDPFGPEPEEIVEPTPPSPAPNQYITTPTRSTMATTPPSYQSTPAAAQVGQELVLPDLPASRFGNDQEQYIIRSTQSLDEYRDVIQDDISYHSALSTGILEDAKKRLTTYELQKSDDFFSTFGCTDVFPLGIFGEHSDESPTPFRRARIGTDPPGASASSLNTETIAEEYDPPERGPGIDWATGLSGHSGLNRVSKSKNGNKTPRRQVRQMGEHRGASHIKPMSSVYTW